MASAARVRVTMEATDRKTFVSALDWPGWSRSGRTEAAAVEAFVAAASRYAVAARLTGLAFDPDGIEVEVVERVTGDGSTTFGVPGAITDEDRRPTTASEAERLSKLVAAAWTVFDAVAAAAPETLRKGPRGGGRDTARIVEHVDGADEGYAGVMGIKGVRGVAERREAMLDAILQPADGSPIGGRKWPPRYAARRIAWHALDHAWEIEDRTESG